MGCLDDYNTNAKRSAMMICNRYLEYTFTGTYFLNVLRILSSSIYIYIYLFIYLTAIGLTPGGSNTDHI
jgi:hypothetical protein